MLVHQAIAYFDCIHAYPLLLNTPSLPNLATLADLDFSVLESITYVSILSSCSLQPRAGFEPGTTLVSMVTVKIGDCLTNQH